MVEDESESRDHESFRERWFFDFFLSAHAALRLKARYLVDPGVRDKIRSS